MATDLQTDAGPGRIARVIGRFVLRIFSILLLVAAWEIMARSGKVTPFVLPSLSSVLVRIWNDLIAGDLLINIGLTLYRALVGFLIAAFGGIAIGMAMSAQPTGELVLRSDCVGRLPDAQGGFPANRHPVARPLRPFQISMIVVDAIFPVVAATVIGIQGVERELIWSARNMGARDRELMWQIILPAALPQIMTGLQVALPLALIVAVVTEMLMGGYGLGGAMITASGFADSRGVFAGIVEIALIGYCLVKAMSVLRGRLLIWHQEAQDPSTA